MPPASKLAGAPVGPAFPGGPFFPAWAWVLQSGFFTADKSALTRHFSAFSAAFVCDSRYQSKVRANPSSNVTFGS
jgi:hypothetical protein